MNNALIYYDEIDFILSIFHKFNDDDSNVLITINVFIRFIMK